MVDAVGNQQDQQPLFKNFTPDDPTMTQNTTHNLDSSVICTVRMLGSA